MHDEENLARRAQQRDPQAFAQLYDANFDKVYRYIVFKIGDRAEAEDLTQQAFLRAWESIESYKWRGMPFSAWLFRIAHNLLVDHLRKKAKRREAPLEEAEMTGSDLTSAVEQKLTAAQVSALCQRLTEAQQEVLSLRFAGGLSLEEAAKAMGKTEGAVKVLQHSALKALRRIMGNDRE